MLLRKLLAIAITALLAGCGGAASPHKQADTEQSDWPGAVISTEDLGGAELPAPTQAGAVRGVTYVSKSGVTGRPAPGGKS